MDFKLNSGIFIIHKVFELSAGLKGLCLPVFCNVCPQKNNNNNNTNDQAIKHKKTK